MNIANDPMAIWADRIAELVVVKLRGPVAHAMPVTVKLPEAAKIMGLSANKVRNMVAAGTLTAIREGSMTLIETREIVEWRERARVK